MNQPNTGKLTYTVVNLTTSQPQFIFPANSTLYLSMGFNRGSTNIFSSSFFNISKRPKITSKRYYIYKVQYCS